MTSQHDSGPVDTTLVVLAGRFGDPVAATDVAVPEAGRVLAADSGLHLASALDLTVDVVIGDLDSVDPETLERARTRGVRIQVHPRDKAHTDLALALHAAVEAGTRRIVVIGGAGGRLDHGLANLAALADDELAGVDVEAVLGGAHVLVVRDRVRTVQGTPGRLLSLQAMGGPARGVTTTGLRWDLTDDELSPTSTRGVSNELREPEATLCVAEGVVLAILPADEDHLET